MIKRLSVLEKHVNGKKFKRLAEIFEEKEKDKLEKEKLKKEKEKKFVKKGKEVAEEKDREEEVDEIDDS